MIVLIAVLASGCAAGGYNAGSLHERLVHAGLPPAEATCVINAMVDKFGHDQLNARVAPIAAELQAERELRKRCHSAAGKR